MRVEQPCALEGYGGMICQICGKEVATVHLTEIEKGKQKELHFCEGCAQKKGVVGKCPAS